MKTLVFQNNKHHQVNENSWYDTKKGSSRWDIKGSNRTLLRRDHHKYKKGSPSTGQKGHQWKIKM